MRHFFIFSDKGKFPRQGRRIPGGAWPAFSRPFLWGMDSKGGGRGLVHPPGGVSKGEGPQSLPFVSLRDQGESKRPGAFLPGCGETGEAPPAAGKASLFRGSGTVGRRKTAGNRIAATVGKGFFSRKECAPRPCSGNYPLREQREQDTSAGNPGSQRAEARFFPHIPALCNKTPLMLQLYYKPPHHLEIYSSECYLSITKQAKL